MSRKSSMCLMNNHGACHAMGLDKTVSCKCGCHNHQEKLQHFLEHAIDQLLMMGAEGFDGELTHDDGFRITVNIKITKEES